DSVAIFYALVRNLSPSLILSIDPTPPGVGPLQGWVSEVGRIYSKLAATCSGVSDDVAKLTADQSFAALRQAKNETIASFSARFLDAAADLTAYTGGDVPDDKLRTTFIRALTPSWRTLAMDLLPRWTEASLYAGYLTN
ncbi:hypothetical protein FOL46_005032, partial [Perkinsus olseni]